MSQDLRLRDADPLDLDFITELEARPEYQDFILADAKETHLAQLQGADHKYLIIEDKMGSAQGYTILAGLESPHGSIELDRLAVNSPQRGVGRFLVKEIMALVFEELKAARLWLDVTRDNRRARGLYESLGFSTEGVMRQAAIVGGRRQDLVIMALLAEEYQEAFSK